VHFPAASSGANRLVLLMLMIHEELLMFCCLQINVLLDMEQNLAVVTFIIWTKSSGHCWGVQAVSFNTPAEEQRRPNAVWLKTAFKVVQLCALMSSKQSYS